MEHVLFAISVETFLEQLRRFFIHFVYCHMFSRYSHAVPFKGCWESLISVSYPGRNTHTQTPSCHIETQADKHSHTGKIKILPSQKTVEVQHR